MQKTVRRIDQNTAVNTHGHIASSSWPCTCLGSCCQQQLALVWCCRSHTGPQPRPGYSGISDSHSWFPPGTPYCHPKQNGGMSEITEQCSVQTQLAISMTMMFLLSIVCINKVTCGLHASLTVMPCITCMKGSITTFHITLLCLICSSMLQPIEKATSWTLRWMLVMGPGG